MAYCYGNAEVHTDWLVCFIPVEAVDMFADKPVEILHKLGEVRRIRQQL